MGFFHHGAPPSFCLIWLCLLNALFSGCFWIFCSWLWLYLPFHTRVVTSLPPHLPYPIASSLFFAVSDSHLGRRANKQLFLFSCHAVLLCVRHANTRALTVTPVQQQQRGALLTHKSTRAVLCGMTQVSLRVETLLVKVRQAGAQTHRLNSCLNTYTHTHLLILLPHKQLLCD